MTDYGGQGKEEAVVVGVKDANLSRGLRLCGRAQVLWKPVRRVSLPLQDDFHVNSSLVRMASLLVQRIHLWLVFRGLLICVHLCPSAVESFSVDPDYHTPRSSNRVIRLLVANPSRQLAFIRGSRF